MRYMGVVMFVVEAVCWWCCVVTCMLKDMNARFARAFISKVL